MSYLPHHPPGREREDAGRVLTEKIAGQCPSVTTHSRLGQPAQRGEAQIFGKVERIVLLGLPVNIEISFSENAWCSEESGGGDVQWSG